MTIRPATREDLPVIAEIQNGAPDAAHWGPETYLDYDCVIAEQQKQVAGFLVSRQLAPGEREILNLAVTPPFRRQGVARRLLMHELNRGKNALFLEVRESNHAAIELYRQHGFSPSGRREAYYHDPIEAGIVMRF